MSETSTSNSPVMPDKTVPEAISRHIEFGKPNEAFRLYSGIIEIDQDGNSYQEDGIITFDWLPYPSINFTCPKVKNGFNFKLDDVAIKLADGTLITECFISSINNLGNAPGLAPEIHGAINGPVSRANNNKSKYVKFLLPNFRNVHGYKIHYPPHKWSMARIILKALNWIISLDAVYEDRETFDFLKSNSGYGITHVGMLEKEDGSLFSEDEGNLVLEHLALYLSFAAGHWTGPLLATGFDSNGSQVWQTWSRYRVSPYRYRESWFDSHHCNQLEGPFPEFLEKCYDENWKEVIQTSVHWYIEANTQAGSIEGSIVLIQSAFEALSSAVMVENYGWLSPEGFSSLKAFDCLRMLFGWTGIPTTIPTTLPEITKEAKSKNGLDSPAIITIIRNSIIHPHRKNREKIANQPTIIRFECWKLSLWYLELCLLKLFKYNGNYSNRLKKRFAGEVESVPWIKTI